MDGSLIEEELTKKIIGAAIAVQTYMQLTECRVGLLMHFNVPVLKDGIKGSSCKFKSITPPCLVVKLSGPESQAIPHLRGN